MTQQLQSAPVQIKPDQIIDIIIRGKWIILIPLCVSLTIGLYMTLTATRAYQASTLILVQPQRVPSRYINSVVTSTISQRISTISQQILSRSNLEKIIGQFGLFANDDNMYLEDKVAALRKRIQVKIDRSRHGAEAFSINFTGNDPQKVMRIANTLASYFMDENLKLRESQAVGTSNFLDSQLKQLRKDLRSREKKLALYRAKYLGGLPDELESNLRALDRLQNQLVAKNLTLRDAKKSLATLQAQIAQSKEMSSQSLGDQFGGFDLEGGQDSAQSEDENKLSAAKKQYRSLLLKYTKIYPDALKLKAVIDKLEKKIKEDKKSIENNPGENKKTTLENKPDKNSENALDNNKLSDTGKSQGGQDMTGGMVDFAAMQQELQLKQAKNDIREIQSDISKIKKQMRIYKMRVDNTPKRELELQALKRDYSNIQKEFSSLLSRKLEAEISANMEKRQKGEHFIILDHARLPEKPISPNVKLLFLLSIASGLGIGGGILFLREAMGASIIRREDQIEKGLGLTILATIPLLEKPGDKIRQKFQMALFIGCSCYAVLFITFFAILNYKGLDRTINFIKMTFNI